MSKQGSTFEPEDGSLKKPNKKSKKPFTIECRATKKFRQTHLRWRLWSRWTKYSGYLKEKNRDEALKALAKNRGEYGMYEFRKGE